MRVPGSADGDGCQGLLSNRADEAHDVLEALRVSRSGRPRGGSLGLTEDLDVCTPGGMRGERLRGRFASLGGVL